MLHLFEQLTYVLVRLCLRRGRHEQDLPSTLLSMQGPGSMAMKLDARARDRQLARPARPIVLGVTREVAAAMQDVVL